MNRFNKIMLLGLLSVVTGATSVKGMGRQFAAVQIGGEKSRFMAMPNPSGSSSGSSREVAFSNATSAGATKFLSLDESNKLGSHEHINMDEATEETISALLNKFNDTDVLCVYPKFASTVANFNQVSAEEQAKIATIYACWIIKNGGLYPEDGKVDLNDKEVQLNEAQNTLLKRYFVNANKSLLNPSEPKKPETKVQVRSSSKARKIAHTAAYGLAAAYLSYLAIGSIAYNQANCTDESSNAVCAATSHANDVNIATYEFLTAAAAATGYSAIALWNLLKQQLQLPALPAKPELPLVTLVNKTLPVEQIGCSCSDKMYEVLNPQDCTLLATIKAPGFFDGLLWIFRR